MNKIKILCAVIALVFVFGACNKSDTTDESQPIQKTTSQSKMIPIAKLTDRNEIEHLFLQKDIQEFFSKENSKEKLVFIEIIDNEKNGREAGLLYRIYNKESNVTETTMIAVLTLEEGIYYYVPPGGGGDIIARSTSCTTSDCSSESDGCVPSHWTSACTPCNNGGKCTRTTSSVTQAMPTLTDAIQYAVSVYLN